MFKRSTPFAIIATGFVLLACFPAVSIAASSCPNETLRAELGSVRLPDCRAYELVSPTTKNGWGVEVRRANGLHVIMRSLGSFLGSDNQENVLNFYTAERSMNNGWITSPINELSGFAKIEFQEGNLKDESNDLSQSIYVLSPISAPGAVNLYIRTLPDGKPIEIGPMLSPLATVSELSSSILTELLPVPSASNNLTSILFEIEGPNSEYGDIDYLWPGDNTAENTGIIKPSHEETKFGFFSLYEYRGTKNSTPELVGVNNENGLISQCGTSLGFPREGYFTDAEAGENFNAISGDGSRVFFTASGATQGPEENACTEAGTGHGPSADELYLRASGSETVAISEPSLSVRGRECTGLCREDENQENGHRRSAGVFQGASEDGSKVFFLTSQSLVNGDDDDTPDLYEAEVGGGSGHEEVTRLVQVSHDPNLGEGADVQGVARVSEDGSHVYFVAHGILTGEASPVGDVARSGADNLYVYNTETNQTAFIGDLCSGAETSGVVSDLECPQNLNSEPPENGGLNDLADWQTKDARPVDVNNCEPSEDECEAGRYLVFTSDADLTPDDTSSVAQVFKYDAKEATLVRVSVGQDGFNDDGNVGNEAASIAYPLYTENQNPAPRLGSVSGNGLYVAFQSGTALTPQALSGYPNVYEYEDGKVSLISDGQDRTSGLGGMPSTSLLGLDESGTDIFFTTADQLAPQDGDTQVDTYDARINGGFPAPAGYSACEGDGCQGALASTPMLPAVGSVVQPAGEDIVEPPARPSAKTKPAKTKPKKAKRKKAKTKPRRAGRKARVENTRLRRKSAAAIGRRRVR